MFFKKRKRFNVVYKAKWGRLKSVRKRTGSRVVRHKCVASYSLQQSFRSYARAVMQKCATMQYGNFLKAHDCVFCCTSMHFVHGCTCVKHDCELPHFRDTWVALDSFRALFGFIYISLFKTLVRGKINYLGVVYFVEYSSISRFKSKFFSTLSL